MVVAAVEDDDGDDPDDASGSTTANPLSGTAVASRGGAGSGRANAEDV